MMRFISFLYVAFYIASALSLYSEKLWLGEAFASMTMQLAIAALALASWALYKADWLRGAICAVFLFWHGGQVPWFKSTTITPNENTTQISILQHNILRYYDNNQLLIDTYAKDNKHDVIFLQEVEQELDAMLPKLLEQFPYQVRADYAKGFDNALLSKLPIVSHEIIEYPYSSYLRAIVQASDKEVVIYGVHAASPGIPKRLKWRNEQLLRLADDINADKKPYRIITGDINVTPYSHWFKLFIERSAMMDSMEGRGIMLTFPSFVMFGLFQVSIDHLMHSPDMFVIDKNVMPALMSDHYAVSTTLGLK